MNDAILNAMLAVAMQEAKAKQTAKKENTRKDAAEAGKALHETYLGFIDAGFNEAQAFKLVLAAFDKVGGDF